MVALKIDDYRRAANVLNSLAGFYLHDHDLERASNCCERALALCHERGLAGLPGIVLNLALVKTVRGEFDAAACRILEAADKSAGASSQFEGIMILDASAALASATGDPARAARLWGAANAVLRRIGKRRSGGDATCVENLVSRSVQALGDEKFRDISARGDALTLQEALGEAKAWLNGTTRSWSAGPPS